MATKKATGGNVTKKATDATAAKVKGPASYFPSIEAKYGKPIDHWMSVIAGMSGLKHMEQVDRLKQDHGLGHGHANALVAHHRAQSS